MLGVTRLTPWHDVASLHRDLDRLFSRVMGETTGYPDLAGAEPAADVRRDGDRWRVSVALPGIPPEKVDVSLCGRTVRIRGERTAPPSADASIGELRYGQVGRDITLPDEIDPRHVRAVYLNGMLDLELPLSEAARPHRIEVQAAPVVQALKAA